MQQRVSLSAEAAAKDGTAGLLVALSARMRHPVKPYSAERVSPTAGQGHILGISLEDYYHAGAFRHLIERSNWRRFESRLEHATHQALDLLDAHDAKATFFTLGWVAEHLPELVREVTARGHEVANSGFSHRGVAELDASALRAELIRGHEAIERATGLAPLGVRIPDFLRERDLWALDVVAELGYTYDASLRPLGTDCRGRPQLRVPFVHHTPAGDLHEFPVPTMKIGPLLVPVGGGNWFRQLPERMVIRAVEGWERAFGAPFSMYFQVWELDADQPRITAASWLTTTRHYRNLDRVERLLHRFLSASQFISYRSQLGMAAVAPAPIKAARDVAPILSEHAPASAWELPALLPMTREDASITAATVVIPCFNEAETLPYLLNTLAGVSRELEQRYRLSYVFVDDGSTDQTYPVLETLVGKRSDCTIVRHATNQGIAHAILTGLSVARDEFVCSIDADCTYDPHQLAALLPALQEGADLVTASPYHPQGTVRHVPDWRLFLSRTLSRLYARRLHSNLHTYTSCFRAYRRSRFVNLALTYHGFLGIAEILVRALQTNLRVVEVPATLEVRLLGHSKLRVLKVIAGHLALLRRSAKWNAALAFGREPVNTPESIAATTLMEHA